MPAKRTIPITPFAAQIVTEEVRDLLRSSLEEEHPTVLAGLAATIVTLIEREAQLVSNHRLHFRSELFGNLHLTIPHEPVTNST